MHDAACRDSTTDHSYAPIASLEAMRKWVLFRTNIYSSQLFQHITSNNYRQLRIIPFFSYKYIASCWLALRFTTTVVAMSSSIQIPRRRRKLTNLERDQAASGASGFSPETPDRFSAGSYGSEKGEGEVVTPTAASRPARRLSLLSKFTNS